MIALVVDGVRASRGSSDSQRRLLNRLANLRQQHLQAVTTLLNAIDKGKVARYLNNQFNARKPPGTL